MKKIIIFIFLSFITIYTHGAVKVMCDVIYKNTEGEWSDFYRTEVTFCLGREINEVLDAGDAFAIIWFSQNQCVTLKMKEFNTFRTTLDRDNIFLFLGSADMINKGIDFEVKGQTDKTKWKIYPKDEIGLFIDPRISRSEEGTIYNKGTLENRRSGFKIDRIKPENDPKHEGAQATIVYKDKWQYYILKCKDHFHAFERNDCTIKKSEIGDIIIGDFSVSNVQKGFYNKSRDIDGYRFTLLKSFDNYEDCVKYIKSKWPY